MFNLISGSSEKDRITYYSENLNATAIRNENREISVEFGEGGDSNLIKSLIAVIIAFGIPSLIKSFIIIPLIKACNILPIFYLSSAFIYIVITISNIVYVRNTGKQDLLRNHGAEHVIFSAYKHLKYVPTPEEVNKFSRISKKCGVTIFTAFITSQIIGFAIYMCTGVIIPEIILFIAPLIFSSKFPLNLLGMLAQFLTTSKPKEENIELAIVALFALQWAEKARIRILNENTNLEVNNE